MKISEAKFQKICKKNVLKDNDFLFVVKVRHPGLVNISFEDYNKVMKKLKKDSKFLMDNNIMDYSLLLAIEDT